MCSKNSHLFHSRLPGLSSQDMSHLRFRQHRISIHLYLTEFCRKFALFLHQSEPVLFLNLDLYILSIYFYRLLKPQQMNPYQTHPVQ